MECISATKNNIFKENVVIYANDYDMMIDEKVPWELDQDGRVGRPRVHLLSRAHQNYSCSQNSLLIRKTRIYQKISSTIKV